MVICGPVEPNLAVNVATEWYVLKDGGVFRVKGSDLEDNIMQDDFETSAAWFSEAGFKETREQLAKCEANETLVKKLEKSKKHFQHPENKGIHYAPSSCLEPQPKYSDYVKSEKEENLTPEEEVNYKKYMKDHGDWHKKRQELPIYERCNGTWMFFFKTAHGKLK